MLIALHGTISRPYVIRGIVTHQYNLDITLGGTHIAVLPNPLAA